MEKKSFSLVEHRPSHGDVHSTEASACPGGISLSQTPSMTFHCNISHVTKWKKPRSWDQAGMVEDTCQNVQVQGGKFRQRRFELLAHITHFQEMPCPCVCQEHLLLDTQSSATILSCRLPTKQPHQPVSAHFTAHYLHVTSYLGVIEGIYGHWISAMQSV